MPINENISKWMGIFSFVRDMLQIVGSDDLLKKSGTGSTGDSGAKQKLKAPGIFAWFTVEDERIWAELFNQLSKTDRAHILTFLNDLEPATPTNMAERFAKKINQGIFRKVVTGLTVTEVPVRGKFTQHKITTGTGKDTKVIDSTTQVMKKYDHRIEFLKHIAKIVKDNGTKSARDHLAAANIIVSDAEMVATTTTIRNIFTRFPALYTQVDCFLEKSEKKVSRVCYWIIGICFTLIAAGIIFLLMLDHIQ